MLDRRCSHAWRGAAPACDARFLTAERERELEFRLVEELRTFTDERIAVRFAFRLHDADGAWFRSYGDESWWFDRDCLVAERHARIKDVPTEEADRLLHRDRSVPPGGHPGLTDLSL